MKEATKKLILGKKFYSVYRKIRFLRYKKKLLKQEKRQEVPEPTYLKKQSVPARKKNKTSFWFRFYRIYRITRFLNRRRKTIRREKILKKRIERRFARDEKKEIRKQLRRLKWQQSNNYHPIAQRSVSKKAARGKGSLKRRIYRIYRIIRFLRSRKKTRRIEKLAKIKWARITTQMERREIKERLREKRLMDRKLERDRRNEEKLLKRTESREIRERLKEKRLLDNRLDRKRAKQEKLERKEIIHNRKRLVRQLFKSRLKSIIFEIKTFDLFSVKRWTSGILAFAENRDKRNNFFIITFNSTVLFILSYMVIYIISQALTIITAISFDYKTILFYYKIYYNIDSYQWTADSVKIIYSLKPAVGIVLGITFIILYSIRRDTPGNMKIFYLWGFIHGMIMFFGSLLMGTMLNKDFGWVIAYMYYRDTGKMIFSIISIFSLVTIGSFVAKSFLISGNSYFNFINRQDNKFLLACQVIWPAIIGTFLLIIVSTPNQSYFMPDDEFVYKILKFLSIFVLLIPTMVTFRTYNEIYFDEAPRKIRLSWKLLLVTLILVLSFRFGLQSGIHFG